MKNISMIGVDLSKNLMHVVFMTGNGTVVKRKKYLKCSILDFINDLPPKVTVCAEACAGAHYFGRLIQIKGYDVKLIPPQYVKPFVQRNKNDYNDAVAIVEAASRDNMKFVPVKSEYIQDIQSLHTAKSQITKVHTAFINCIRGILAEFEITIPQGVASFKRYLREQFNDDGKIPCHTRIAVNALVNIFNEIEEMLLEVNRDIDKVARTDSKAKRLITIPGVGEKTATALLTVSGDPKVFKNGRTFSASLGLTPRQNTTADNQKLLGISKQGNMYVRRLLVGCARSLINKAMRRIVTAQRTIAYMSNDGMSLWIRRLLARNVHSNKVCVAVANKLARISYRILVDGGEYKANLSNGSPLKQ